MVLGWDMGISSRVRSCLEKKISRKVANNYDDK